MSYTPIIAGTGLAGWSYLSRTLQDQQQIHQRTPEVQRDIAAFHDRVEGIATADNLLDDRQLLRVALGAFGLDEEINNSGFLQRVLESNLNDPRSLANRLSDKRFFQLAEAFGFTGPGPRIDGAAGPLDERLRAVESAEALISDRSLLRDALAAFDLERDAGNPFFLQRVLESDLTDPDAFVFQIRDNAYLEFARAFDFAARSGEPGSAIDRFRTAFDGRLDTLSSADDLLDDPALRAAALDIFGISDTGDTDFLRRILNSDPDDPDSVASGQSDTRYKALSGAFGFGAPPTAPGDTATPTPAAAFLTALADIDIDELARGSDVIFRNALRQATAAFFGVPNRNDVAFLRDMLDSDPTSATSRVGLHPDKRYLAMSTAFGFGVPEAERTYPPGFADEIVRRYVDRSFEVRVGAVDNTMRLALSLPRELQQVTEGAAGEAAQWYRVMASPPLRSVFETALRLPSSVGSLDLDQQLDIFRDRAEQQFGTRRVDGFADVDRLDALRQRFLTFADAAPAASTAGGATLALSLLSGAPRA